MSDKIPSSQDVLNLFDLVEVIWKERLTIVLVTLFASGLGGLSIYFSEKQYETTINFQLDVIPPFLEKSEAFADASQFFRRSDLFAEWKKANPGSNLSFEMIDERQIIDGNAFAVDEAGRFIVINKGQLVVRSNDIDLVSDIADYLSFVSTDLTQSYFEQEKQYQSTINSVFNEPELPSSFRNGPNASMERALVNRFVFKVEQGLRILSVSRPNPPKRIDYRPKMTVALYVFLGITIGSVFVLFRNSYRQHQAVRLAKTRNEVA